MSHYFKNNRAFSLTELTVSIGIVFVILTVVVSNQSTYTDGAALSNLADELSISVSRAQAYGIGVKELNTGSADFTASYGITLSLLGSGSNKAYLFFADRNSNLIYDGTWDCVTGGASECVEKVDILRGNYIESLCVVVIAGPDDCASVGRIDISFKRPDIDAQLIFFNTSGVTFVPPNMKGVKIVLRSPAGAAKNITVYGTGQVSVQ